MLNEQLLVVSIMLCNINSKNISQCKFSPPDKVDELFFHQIKCFRNKTIKGLFTFNKKIKKK